MCQMVNKQLYQLVEYARRMPHFSQLQKEDQITLLRSGWNELLIASVAWRSIEVSPLLVDKKHKKFIRFDELSCSILKRNALWMVK